MIEAIRIQNLRSLEDTGFIDIKPLTILVGVNSSGKSTFLRSFPLFTQSITKNLRGVISWYDDAFVDLGSYAIAKSKFAENTETIKFSYKVKLNAQQNLPRRFDSDNRFIASHKIQNCEVELSFKSSNSDSETYVNSVFLKINEEFSFSAIIDKNYHVKFKINEKLVELKNDFIHYKDFHIFPDIYCDYTSITQKLQGSRTVQYAAISPFEFEIYVFFKEYQSKVRLNKSIIDKIHSLFDLWSLNKVEFLEGIKDIKFNNDIDSIIEKWDIDNKEFEKIYNIISTKIMLYFFRIIDEELYNFYLGCSYVAPIRTMMYRNTRTQGLQVADIGSNGENLADFVKSLKPEQKKSYDDFLNKILNIKVEVKSYPTGLSLFLTQANGMFNITDVGFGYSQILPIATKLWWWHYNSSTHYYNSSLAYYRSNTAPTILIEQPELHLHPAYQAKIADAFINSVIKKNIESTKPEYRQRERMNLIIETHSETIINRIGRRIYEGHLSPEEVNVVIFEKDYNKPRSVVNQTTFDKQGRILKWPRGFFDPIDEPLYN